jgi:basic membrane protein A
VKRRIVAVLAGAALLVAAGCGGGGGAQTGAEATTGGHTFKVGLVTDIGELNDHGFNHLAYVGLLRAQRELGVQGRVAESRTAADYIPNLAGFARSGYDLVISVGFAQGKSVATAAKRFPKMRFAIIDVDQASLPGKPKNVVGLVFREQEVGYLAGYLAAKVDARRPGVHAIGSVGGMKEPPVDRYIAGYQAGARRAVPGIKLFNSYSQDWDDEAKCKEAALNEISRGAGVVFQVAGGCGLGALDAAREKHVWGVGVDADQSFLGPHILTSAEKKVDQAVLSTIKSVVHGTWRGGRNRIFGLRENGVGLGKISPRAPKGDLVAVRKLARKIASGQIKVPTKLTS